MRWFEEFFSAVKVMPSKCWIGTVFCPLSGTAAGRDPSNDKLRVKFNDSLEVLFGLLRDE